MHHVNQLLEQEEVARDGPDTRTNQDAVKLPLLKLGGDYRLRSLAKVGETMLRVIADSLQSFLRGGESCHHLCGGHTGKCGEVGRGEINQFGVQPDDQGTPPSGIIGSMRRGLRFSVHIQEYLLGADCALGIATPNVEVWHGGYWASRAKRTRDVARRCHHCRVRLVFSWQSGDQQRG